MFLAWVDQSFLPAGGAPFQSRGQLLGCLLVSVAGECVENLYRETIRSLANAMTKAAMMLAQVKPATAVRIGHGRASVADKAICLG